MSLQVYSTQIEQQSHSNDFGTYIKSFVQQNPTSNIEKKVVFMQRHTYTQYCGSLTRRINGLQQN